MIGLTKHYRNKKYFELPFSSSAPITYTPIIGTSVGTGTSRFEFINNSVIDNNTPSISLSGSGINRVWVRELSNIGQVDIDNCALSGSVDFEGVSNISTALRTHINPNLTNLTNLTSSQLINTGLIMYQCGFDNVLDLRGLTGAGGIWQFYSCPSLKEFYAPITTESISSLSLYSCNSLEKADLSGVINLGGNILLNSNPNLTQIINPTSSQPIDFYYTNNTALSTLDLSQLSGLGGQFRTQGCSNLTQIINPTSSQAFTRYWAYNCNLSGTLNLSSLSGLGGDVGLDGNPNLTQIIFPTSSQVFTLFDVGDTNIVNLDLSQLSNLGGVIRFDNNPSLQTVVFPTSSQVITTFQCGDLDNFSSSIDLSQMTGLGGFIGFSESNINGIPNLQNLILPTTTQSINYFAAAFCNLSGTLDLSSHFSEYSGGTNRRLYINSNSNLNTLVFPTSSLARFSDIYIHSCDLGYCDFTVLPSASHQNSFRLDLYDNNMTAAEVNHILVDIDSGSISGYTGRNINLSGTNAAPDNSSGGFDGLAATGSLISKGFTVTTS